MAVICTDPRPDKFSRLPATALGRKGVPWGAGRARFTDDPVVVDTGNSAPGYLDIVEMGAYERYEFCGSGVFSYPSHDVTGPDGIQDCLVDFFDFADFAAHWLEDARPE